MTPFFEWESAPKAEFAVIGDPVRHSLSPRMHRAALERLGLPHRYVAVHVLAGQVAAALDRLAELGTIGVNVTVPHKAEAFRACRSTDPFSKRVGAVNTVRLSDRSGTNTDGPGFLETLAPLGLEAGSTAFVLGAGGAARAIVLALVERGFVVRLFNRTRARAESLVSELAVSAQIVDEIDVRGSRLVVNTTSAGLHGEGLAVDWAGVASDTVAYDIVYGEKQTRFLAEAAQAGLRTIDGRPLLAAQGALSLEWWLGVEAPRNIMLESIGHEGG